jgi:alcohol dehydrogenase class IV
MSLVSTYAGFAHLRATMWVMYIAHQFGGYHTPHGSANAIMLPHVQHSRPAIIERLAHWRCAPKWALRTSHRPSYNKSFFDVDQLNHDLVSLTHLRPCKSPTSLH